jgi:DNA invertase Pin-like site-specific DNA recombinase
MKGIGYVRVSTLEQAREGISLEHQRAKIKSYCVLHDIELVGIIEDAGKSGKNLNREGICALMEQIKNRQINAVIVYKMDRLSRRVIDTLNLIELMKKHDIEFHAITDAIDTKTATGKFVLNIMASLAQMERDLISERTKDALSMKIAKHERVGSVRYGFNLGADGKTLVEDSEQQKAIKTMHDLHRNGCSYRTICAELGEQGFAPMGQKWHAKTVMSVLKRTAA